MYCRNRTRSGRRWFFHPLPRVTARASGLTGSHVCASSRVTAPGAIRPSSLTTSLRRVSSAWPPLSSVSSSTDSRGTTSLTIAPA